MLQHSKRATTRNLRIKRKRLFLQEKPPLQRGKLSNSGDQIVSLRLPAPRNRSASQQDLPATRAMGRTDGRALAFAASTNESTGEEWMPPGAPLRAE